MICWHAAMITRLSHANCKLKRIICIQYVLKQFDVACHATVVKVWGMFGVATYHTQDGQHMSTRTML